MTNPAVRHHHEDQVRDLRLWLAALPDLVARLWLFRKPGSTPPDPDASPSSGKPGSRPAVNLAVLDLLDVRNKPDASPVRDDYDLDRIAGRRQGVIPVLASWVRLIDTELWDRGILHLELGSEACTANCSEAMERAKTLRTEGPCSADARAHLAAPTVAGECAAILTHLDWCADQKWFGELHDDVKGIRRDVRHAIGDRDQEPMRCTVLGCGWSVEEQAGGSYYRCTGCGKTWSRLELHRLTERQRPMRLSEIARVIDTPVGTLKRWEYEGRINHMLVLDGVKHYSLALCEKAKDRVERPGRRRASALSE